MFSFCKIVIGVVDDPRWKLKFPVDPSAAPLALTVHLLFGYPVFLKLISPKEFAAEVIPTWLAPVVAATSRLKLGLFVPIPTLPEPLTNNILFTAGESILSKLADDAPEMYSNDVGVEIPIPTLPINVVFPELENAMLFPLYPNIPSRATPLRYEVPFTSNKAVGVAVPIPTLLPLTYSVLLVFNEPVMFTEPVTIWFPLKVFEPVVANEPVLGIAPAGPGAPCGPAVITSTTEVTG